MPLKIQSHDSCKAKPWLLQHSCQIFRLWINTERVPCKFDIEGIAASWPRKWNGTVSWFWLTRPLKASAHLVLLRNLDYIDYDPGRMFCTPCTWASKNLGAKWANKMLISQTAPIWRLLGWRPGKGQEYKHTMTLVPRPIGRGLKANKKFLPYLGWFCFSWKADHGCREKETSFRFQKKI